MAVTVFQARPHVDDHCRAASPSALGRLDPDRLQWLGRQSGHRRQVRRVDEPFDPVESDADQSTHERLEAVRPRDEDDRRVRLGEPRRASGKRRLVRHGKRADDVACLE
jgi:hypothetical protein